jgi:hypothetical protein
MKINAKSWILFVLLASPILYVSSCFGIAHHRDSSMNSVIIGDTLEDVVAKMGRPSHIDSGAEYYTRYIGHPCSTPGCKRFWYENHLALDVEAWFVELDIANRVVRKDRLSSP